MTLGGRCPVFAVLLTACGGRSPLESTIQDASDASLEQEGAPVCLHAPTPTTIATISTSAEEDIAAGGPIAITTSHVYFLGGLKFAGGGYSFDIRRVSRCGGAVEKLTTRSSTNGGAWLALGWDHVFWSNGTGVLRVPITGGSGETYSSLPATSLFVDGTNLLVNTSTAGPKWNIYVLPEPGGQKLLMSDRLLMLADQQRFYSLTPSGSLIATTRNGGAERELLSCCPDATLPCCPVIEVSDGAYVYYRYLPKGPANQLFRVPVDGGPIETVTKSPWEFNNVAVDAEFVYGYDAQHVVRVAKTGGAPEVVATLGDKDWSIAALTFGASEIYWVSSETRFRGDSRIMKLERH